MGSSLFDRSSHFTTTFWMIHWRIPFSLWPASQAGRSYPAIVEPQATRSSGKSPSNWLWILTVEAGWPDAALKGIFYQSLIDCIKNHLCAQPETTHFEELVNAALRLDIRLHERHAERSHQNRKPPPNAPSLTLMSNAPSLSGLESPPNIPEEPMQIGHSKLTAEERLKRKNEGLCFCCGNPGHLVTQCTLRLNSRTPPPPPPR